MSHDLNHFIIGLISKIGKTFFILISVFLFINSIQGQQINRKSKIEIDIGLTDFGRFFDFNDVDGNYQLSVFYRISNSISLGLQGAYAGLKWNTFSTVWNESIYAHAISYNLAGKVYITSLLSTNDDRKLHIYAKGKIGAHTLIPRVEDPPLEGTNFDYGAYLGLEITPIKRAGLFLDIGYGKYNYTQFGLLFRF